MEKEKKINLEEILNDCVYIDNEIKPMVKNAMREACRQILELAAENADAEIICGYEGDEPYAIVDKQSILNTINLVE